MDDQDRALSWPGCWNVRDLGGLSTIDGRRLARGALIRSDGPHRLGQSGWEGVHVDGVRTVVDLRDVAQRSEDPYELPPELKLTLVPCPIEEGLEHDSEFASWIDRGWLATPLYYSRFIERWPERVVDAVRVVAEAPPGGVLVHCRKGSDRTGLVVLAILALLEVDPDEIIEDHLETRTRAASAAAGELGWEDDTELIDLILHVEGTTARGALREALSGTPIQQRLADAGLDDTLLTTLQNRLVLPAA